MNNILLIGSGGREHALAWKLSQSNSVHHIFVAPGNGGTTSGKLSNVPITPSKQNFEQLGAFAKENKIALVVVGPEQPLVDGITEYFKSIGIPCFGPSSKAAILESSKAFSKDFMKRHNIPTAKYEIFTDYNKALEYIRSAQHPVVLKASGLAAGKGVLLPTTTQEAEEGLKQIMLNKEFGAAGEEVVIEERLNGPEVSVFALSDGYTVIPLTPAQDHKRAFDHDEGPNTGGMGAYCPAPMVDSAKMQEIIHTVLEPTIRGMRRVGRPYVGLLYAGILLDDNKGVQVLEYNCRFGDPETQAVLMTLESDLYDVMMACVEGRLDSIQVESRKNCFAATVVLASKGYPGSYEKGKEISGLELFPPSSDIVVFHAGTSASNNNNTIVTSGGRVLNISACGQTLQEAVNKCYQTIQNIHFDGMFCRRDIGHRALTHYAQLEAISKSGSSVTYKDSGVDIDSGNALVKAIKIHTKSTARVGTDAKIGGFGGLFDMKAIGYKDPILVSGTDGVGTKLLIAQQVGKHDTIGIDLVAMSVNDCLVHGAEPLFFLDYYATGKLDVDCAAAVVKGIAWGCKESGCALIGGETAEMPGLYSPGEYDLAGFAVSVVERDEMLPKAVQVGDILLGLGSSGVHSNGYSLVRYLIKKSGLTFWDDAPFSSEKKPLHEFLLAPTRLYVKSCLPVIRKGWIKALSHITGGGLPENLPRVLNDQVAAEVDLTSWTLPPLFKWLQQVGNVATHELLRTFNCGIGMVLVVSPDKVDSLIEELRASGESVFTIGRLIDRQQAQGKSFVTKGDF